MLANASPAGVFIFGPPGRPVSLFSCSPQTRGMERREAPGGLRDLLRPGLRDPACASCEDARARAKGPAPPDAPSAARVVGGRTLLRHPTSRSTTPSIEQDTADIDQDVRTAKFNPRVCKVLA